MRSPDGQPEPAAGGAPGTVRGVIARNTAFNAAGRAWEAVTGLLLTIYILERIDFAAWGLWSLVAVFTGYVSLLDFGIGSGFAKYIAEHAARNERDRLSAVVSTGFFFYLALGPALVVAGWPCIDWCIAGVVRLMTWLAPERAGDFRDLALLSDVRFLFRWGLVLFAVSNCASAFTAVQTGLQRMGVTNVISFAASLIKIASTVLFLELGFGVRGLLYSSALVTGAFALASMAAAFRLAPDLRVSPRRIERATFRALFSFGWRAQIAKLANLVMYQTDKVIVGLVYAQFGPIGVYRFGEELANKVRQGPLMLLSALIPAASDLDARDDHDRLRRLYLTSSKYVAAVAVPALAFAAASAGLLVHACLGDKDGVPVAAWVLRFIAVGNIANVISGAGVSVALGRGRADLHMKAGLIAAGANVVLTVALYLAIGFYGIPLATMLAMFITWGWFLAAMKQTVPVHVAEFFRTVLLWPALAAAPGIVICAAVDAFGPQGAGRLPNAALAMAAAAGFGVLYLAIMRCAPFLDGFDVDFLGDTLRLRRLPGFRFLTGRAQRV
ncbi:MAG: oligosaccharide flippase family protein [Candidatus Hydrogenedentes bacterium]|nr:oligosaccharide flippase family protein [Candidatus Hydrogenedentota bacterium]